MTGCATLSPLNSGEPELATIRTAFFCRLNLLHVFFILVQGDTSGDYRKTLLLLCGGED